MPYTANSLGHWMKQHRPSKLQCTAGTSPIRNSHGAPHGAASYLRREYAFRYGHRHHEPLPDGTTKRVLRVGLITDNYSMFVFRPLWAPRLPVLSALPDPCGTLVALPPGNTIGPSPFSTGQESGMNKLYEEDNVDLDYWWHNSCCEPWPIWARYTATDDLREVRGVLWRRLYSIKVDYLKQGKFKPGWEEDFPEERLATLKDFPTDLYVREDVLHVLGHSKEELNNVYNFYIFKPHSRHIVVLDNRCNVIVAMFQGGTLTNKA